MSRRDKWLLTGLLVATFLSRIPFRSRIPYGLDSIQFILGTESYDVRLHQPHPPGYFLFVMMGKVVQQLFQSANLSFVVINMVFSSLAVWMVFLLARKIFRTGSAFLSAVLMATSPLFWFHGEVALSNMADCFFVCLLALLCWKNFNSDYKFIYLSAVVLGLAGGIRQNTLAFLFPLWIVSIQKAGWRRILFSGTLLVLTVAAWYLPMAQLSGGLTAYQTAVRDHWLNSNWHGFTLEWLLFNIVCVGYFILLGAGLGSIFLFLALVLYLEKVRLGSISKDTKFQFFAAWLIPPLAFFVMIYSHPIQTGHSLIYLPALLILLPGSVQLLCSEGMKLLAHTMAVSGAEERDAALNRQRVAENVVIPKLFGDALLRSSRAHHASEQDSHAPTEPSKLTLALAGNSQSIVFALFLILLGCNLLAFLSMGTAVSRNSIRQYELNVSELIAAVRARYSIQETILLNYDFMFLGFRDFMFHLPEYHTYQPQPYSLSGKALLFAGFQRKTQLVDGIEIPSTAKCFVLNADEFMKNPLLIQGIQLSKFPSEQFLVTPSGLRLFRGDIHDLPKFFPQIQFEYQ